MELNKFSNEMNTNEVAIYKKLIEKKLFYIIIKRILDVLFSIVLLIILIVPMAIVALLIYIEDRNSPLYVQERVTKNGKIFKIYKFRSMSNIKSIHDEVTLDEDPRITRIGKILRKYRIDELPQLVNILLGDMSFVGTRPEVVNFVEQYSPEMYATLLLPSGVTSLASIKFKDEAELLSLKKGNISDIYVNEILPKKMQYNYEYLRNFSFFEDAKIIFLTIKEVFF
ncbi:TPA: sugar transferase [Enterococcus faecium]|uniref:sugar transferase n=1 Tax=Enterococcus faecium TaxID=1352 RepID=UPI0003A26AA2|nr:sugar transferase [Enterococcus faecium]ERK34541.1 hypothetical protein I131_11080 [Enterococcus faecium CRL1879]MBD9939848.1 sugar transferase [Enterococcus faecium]MDQ8322714.1 sugar transferase [Enterococcus faecium]MDQ8330473.1 sugar transferase [Enterococcus faecium]MDT2372384.1 sugar transferase [Enterococcus faecium]